MIFLDTSFLVAVEVEGDQNHRRAVDIKEAIKKGEFGEVVISDYIFDETVTVTFVRTRDLQKTVFAGENLRNSAKMIQVDNFIFEEAWGLFRRQKNTKLSFTDCTNVSIIKKYGIKNIETFDKDFRKVGGVKVIC